MKRREYDDHTAHTYINANGDEVPSVTHILSMIKKKETLKWSNFLGFKHISVEKFINHRAMIGTLLHKKIECYYSGTAYDPHPSPGIEQEVNLLFNNFVEWDKMNNPNILASEMQLIGLKYGGTLDLLCEMYDHKICLVDFKTSKSIHAAQFMQLGGYLNLLKETKPEVYKKIDICQIVSITQAKVNIKMKGIKDMKKYQRGFENSYILYNDYNTILEEDWDDSMRDVSIL